jgi:DNA-binding response OmpR family regulator
VKARILLVEDDPGMAEVAAALLKARGHKTSVVSSAEEALGEVRRLPPDLVISDIQLPGLSGLKLCELLRGEPRTASIPFILLTVLGKNSDKVAGLRLGADDYLSKPYDPEELAARVEALLRRVHRDGRPEEILSAAGLAVNVGRREAALDDRPLRLRRKEFELLVLFLRKKGEILTRVRICAAVWGDAVVTDNTLTVHLKNLRAKLGKAGDRIETLIGEGYRFRA